VATFNKSAYFCDVNEPNRIRGSFQKTNSKPQVNLIGFLGAIANFDWLIDTTEACKLIKVVTIYASPCNSTKKMQTKGIDPFLPGKSAQDMKLKQKLSRTAFQGGLRSSDFRTCTIPE